MFYKCMTPLGYNAAENILQTKIKPISRWPEFDLTTLKI